jgi:ABC-type multidrug transport system ATPase subunit
LASTDFAVQTFDLTKQYRKGTLAVDALNLIVQRGEVYGFLGPNGAGKTTTLKMLVGLIRPTRGSARVVGLVPGDRDALKKIGALIESPGFYPYLSGRDNLRVMASYCGVDDRTCEVVLDQVDLGRAAESRFKTYSSGMKQRLGLAAALLKQPDVLILDEPSSGLDPQGMVEMRELIRNLAGGDRTVLLSSHLLGEVEQICDRIGVIHHGRLVSEGKLDELRGSPSLVITAKPIQLARSVAESIIGSNGVNVIEDTLRISIEPARSSEVVRRMVEAGVEVQETRHETRSLEDVFLSLTKDEDR